MAPKKKIKKKIDSSEQVDDESKDDSLFWLSHVTFYHIFSSPFPFASL